MKGKIVITLLLKYHLIFIKYINNCFNFKNKY